MMRIPKPTSELSFDPDMYCSTNYHDSDLKILILFDNIASVQMVLILIYWDIVDFIILLKNWIVL